MLNLSKFAVGLAEKTITLETMGDLRLEELSGKNSIAANSLTLKPGQADFIKPMSLSIFEENVNASATWTQVVLSDDEVVAYILATFDPEASEEEMRSCLLRLHVSAHHQGEGVGRFAIDAVAKEASSRGFDHVNTIWDEGEEGPEEFFVRVGFAKTGHTRYGEAIGELTLN